MNKVGQRFFVHCNATTSRYLLAREGELWQQEFKCLLGAMLYAASIIQERTPVTLFNEFGVAFQERVVIPNRE
jgi:hypothetical protein